MIRPAVTGALLYLFAFAAGPSAAQPQVITVEEAVRTALARNIDVVQAANRVATADATVLAAYGNYLPSLSASGSYGWTQTSRQQNVTVNIPGIGATQTQEEFFGVNRQWSTGLSGNLTIFDGLSREATVSSSRSQRTAAERTSSRTRQAVVNQVFVTYLNILRTEQLVLVAEENLRRDQRQLERITESSRVGALSVADVYRQQSQVAADELDLITAQNNHAKSRADLVALIGIDPAGQYEFRDTLLSAPMSAEDAEAVLQLYRDLASATGRALAARPDYDAVRAGYDAASADVIAAYGSYWPQLGLSGSYGNFAESARLLAVARNYNLSWNLNLRWNLFDGFLREQRLEAAKVEERNAEVELTQAGKNIRVEVTKALLDLEAAKKSWDVSQKALVSAREDRRIAEERYNLGAGTLLDLLVANANYVNAEAARVNAVAGFLAARHAMEFAIGEHTY